MIAKGAECGAAAWKALGLLVQSTWYHLASDALSSPRCLQSQLRVALLTSEASEATNRQRLYALNTYSLPAWYQTFMMFSDQSATWYWANEIFEHSKLWKHCGGGWWWRLMHHSKGKSWPPSWAVTGIDQCDSWYSVPASQSYKCCSPSLGMSHHLPA